MKYVIARLNEDTSWSDELDRFIVQKGVHVPDSGKDHGREASSWLWYIARHYDELEGTYAFRQGTPEGPYHGIMWTGTLEKELNDYRYDILPVAEHLGIDLPDTLYYALGAQYDVDAETIKLRTKEWYEEAYKVAEEWPQAPWIFERLWPHIWYNQAIPWTPNY